MVYSIKFIQDEQKVDNTIMYEIKFEGAGVDF